jgi:UDP-glucose 6-dehydrogenase
VPGPDGDYGYGGHCFPKDIAALKFVASNMNVKTTVLNAAIEKNGEVRTDLDWTKQIGRAVSDD